LLIFCSVILLVQNMISNKQLFNILQYFCSMSNSFLSCSLSRRNNSLDRYIAFPTFIYDVYDR